MTVKECMCDKVEYVSPNCTVSDVAKLMGQKHIGCVPVCDNNKLVGLVTDRDLILRCIANEKDCKSTPISEIMTTNVKTVTPDTDINETTKLMCDCQVRRIPVTDPDYKLVGIITVGDLANNNSIPNNEVANTVEKICNCNGNIQNAE